MIKTGNCKFNITFHHGPTGRRVGVKYGAYYMKNFIITLHPPGAGLKVGCAADAVATDKER